MYKGIVYCYQNKINKKRYIGYTTNEAERRRDHLRVRDKNTYFKKAIKKYGIDNFDYSILYEIQFENKIELIPILHSKEIEFIALYKSNTRRYGYNLTKGGDGTTGYRRIQSPETRLKISNTLKGRRTSTISLEARKVISLKNSKLSFEDVINISNLLKTTPVKELSELYGVSKRIIGRIKRKECWKSVLSS